MTGDDGSKTGGLVGMAYGGEIHNSVAYGATSVPSAASTTHLGGFIGNNSSDSRCMLSDFYWSTSAVQTYCGAARSSDEMLGIGNYTAEADASDTTCSAMAASELKTQTFMNALNSYVETENTAGTLRYPLRTWILDTADGYPGFVAKGADTPPTDDGSSYEDHDSAPGGGNSNNATNVYVNGEEYSAGTAQTETENGQKIKTITVKTAKLDAILDSEGDGATVTIPVLGGSDVACGVLTGLMVKNMEQKAATLAAKTDSSTYTLPAEQINIDKVAEQFGEDVGLSGIEVKVTISEPDDSTVLAVENSAEDGGFTLVVQPVEFMVTCTYDGKTTAVTTYNAYVKRTIKIPDGVAPEAITTAVVVESDGTVRHVPTQIDVVDGVYFAVINSLTNSVYTLINHVAEFSDVDRHWAENNIEDMASRLIITGYSDGTFHPGANITRAEFAAILIRALGLPEDSGESSFTDVADSDWCCGYINTAASYGIAQGYNNENFGANERITREQAMVMAARAMKMTGLEVSLNDSQISGLLGDYQDGVSVSGYAEGSVAACLKTGIVSGTGDSMLVPKDNITRAEVAVMIQRLLMKSELI